MAYNPYTAVNAIYKLKGQWDSANNADDNTKKNEAAKKAQEYYKQLRDNGYGDVADELTASDYANSKAINDRYAKLGKSATRPYFYTLGQSTGLSQKQIDDLISYDNATGEVSFGGKNIGKPDSVVDGVSYWSDTTKLDNAFNDYIQRSGTTASDSQLSSQNNMGIKSKINELWGIQTNDHSDMNNKYNDELQYLKNTNPFDTAEAKSILAKYDLSALQGRDNVAASGAASNSGNIDSYAAANALRQQAALISQGQETVLAAHQQKLDHAKELLEGLGVYRQNQYTGMQDTINQQQTEAQRLFENDETAKNNDVARKQAIADTTGYAPDEWVVSNNPYMNDDGTIKDEYKNADFKAIINAANAAGNTEAAKAARVARAYKILGNYDLYGKYDDGDYILPGQQKTENARQFDVQNETALKLAADENALAEKQLNAETALAQQQLDTEAALKREELATDVALEREKMYNSTKSSGSTSSKSGSAKNTPIDLSSDMKSFITSLNNYAIKQGLSKVLNTDGTIIDTWANTEGGTGADELLAHQLKVNEKLSDAEKAAFIELWGLSPEVLDTVTGSARYRNSDVKSGTDITPKWN